MKLLLCTSCWDVRKLGLTTTTCECGRVSGKYLDDQHHAEVRGVGVEVLLIGNGHLLQALYGREPGVMAEVKRVRVAGYDHPRIQRN